MGQALLNARWAHLTLRLHKPSPQADIAVSLPQIMLFYDLIESSGCGRAGASDAACRLAAESAQADFVPL